MIAHFYHALDTPKGHEIYDEHVALMAEAKFVPDLFDVTWVKPGEGWPEITLNKLRSWALSAEPGSKVMFSHTKGTHSPGAGQDRWRNHVEDRLIGAWEVRLSELDTVDVVCLHWLSPADSLPSSGIVITNEFAAGGFFWARAKYIARLPELPELTLETRDMGEAWIGYGNPPPVVKDLRPGFPYY